MSFSQNIVTHSTRSMRQPQTRRNRDENAAPDADCNPSYGSAQHEPQSELSNCSNTVTRLKMVFQKDEVDTKPVNIPRLKGRNFADIRSPDIKRKRDANSPESINAKQLPQVGQDVDPQTADPQKFFETTNHVQRFKYTRAIFARMEEQSRKEREQQKYSLQRRATSPGRQPIMSPPPRSPVSPPSRGPPGPAKPRSVSEPGFRQARHRADSGEPETDSTVREKPLWESSYRAGSVDNLDQVDNKRHRIKQMQREDQMSRSETDLSCRDAVESSVPSPKWLIKHYETEMRKSSSHQPVTANVRLRPNNRTMDETGAMNQRTTSLSSSSSSSSKPPSVSSEARAEQTSLSDRNQSNAAHGLESEHSASKNSVVADKTRTHSVPSYITPKPTSSTSVIARPTRLLQDHDQPKLDNNKPTADGLMHKNIHSHDWRDIRTSSTSSSAAVLLPKRRSRDENGLSKEEIEASLNEADKYWRRSYGELSDAMDNKMTDSTYSSGSGEEMARSESNHELLESPVTPSIPEKPRGLSWTSKYSYSTTSNNAVNISNKNLHQDGTVESLRYQKDNPENPKTAEPPTYPLMNSDRSIFEMTSEQVPNDTTDGNVGQHDLNACEDMETSVDTESDYVNVPKSLSSGSSASLQSPQLPIHKVASPDDSVSSMTLSEQDQLLSKV
ncbi:hypothetical protein LSH36_51g04006 [Paralvinella palmiformis]|uniref:Uncharacterized protein n=1 Tax=Paralvinella palmiformis TaxID=53620 RepID=A0AAD9K5P7_9ANNE|nr:hypothetical protein LSH36_51g04006 [Paralvinella palmiformis]